MSYRFDTRHLTGQQQTIIRNRDEENKRLKHKSNKAEEGEKTVIADWFMVEDNLTQFGTKKTKPRESLLNISRLRELTNYVIENGNKDHEMFSYLFSDLLVVQQGVYKWNEESKSYNKVADKHSGISEAKPLKS